MTDLQKQLVRALQNGIPVVERPFQVIADSVGITEEQLIQELESMKASGMIRRFGAILRHQEVGFSANAMVVWNVPDEKVEEFGNAAAAFAQISHCYQRPRFEGFPYNMYTMIHGQSKSECEETARKLSKQCKVSQFELLYTITEYKKSSPVFFEEGVQTP